MTKKTIYLALYKGNREGWSIASVKARFGDWITRKITRGIYSHCEIAVPCSNGGYACYSSSIRDAAACASSKWICRLKRPDRWFCSEFCADVMGIPDGWRFSPNDLAAIAGKGGR